jgi:arginine deiminase
MNKLKNFANDTVIKDLALECKQYRELIARLYDDLAAVKKAHKEAVEFNYDLAEENTTVHTKVLAMQERIAELEKVAEVGCDMYRHYVPDDTMEDTGWLGIFRAAGYLGEGK